MVYHITLHVFSARTADGMARLCLVCPRLLSFLSRLLIFVIADGRLITSFFCRVVRTAPIMGVVLLSSPWYFDTLDGWRGVHPVDRPAPVCRQARWPLPRQCSRRSPGEGWSQA